MFFLCPETTYNRSKRYDTDVRETLAGESDSESTDGEPAANEKHLVAVDVTEPDATVERKISYWQLLKVYNGRFSNEKYVRAVISPFATFMLPGISWAAYTYGCSVAFSDALSVCLSQIFTKPPYNFFTSSVGLTILLLFAANIIGNFVPGPVSDWIVTSMSSENNGVYEPEFRNILSIPALITGLAGYWEFGLAIHHRVHWFVPVFLFALAGFSGSILSLISNTYLLDCHRKYAQDGYAAVTLVKAVMTFAITFFVNSWLLNSGPVQVFFVIGTIHGIGCIWGIVLYIFGKRVSLLGPDSSSVSLTDMFRFTSPFIRTNLSRVRFGNSGMLIDIRRVLQRAQGK